MAGGEVPDMAGELGTVWNAVFIASILVAVVGTLLMAFFADMPFAQACGMGLNSFFCTIFVAGAAFAGVSVIRGYQAGLVIVFVSGLVFLILSVTGLRKYIAVAMPECLKKVNSSRYRSFYSTYWTEECNTHPGQSIHICTVL